MLNTSAARIGLVLLIIGFAANQTASAANSMPAQQQSQLAQLQQHSVVSGDFKQQRQLRGLPRAIESSGRFVFWRQHGLYWETLQPFYQATTFTVDDVIHWNSVEGPALETGPEDPVQQYVSKVMLSLFSANLETLDKLFESRWRSDESAWSLELVPVRAGVARVIQHIRLEGDQFLRRLSVDTQSGDRNTMLLDNITTPPSLSPLLCRRFSRKNDKACLFAGDQD